MHFYSKVTAALLSACYMHSCVPSDAVGPNIIFERLSYHQPQGFTDSILTGTYEVYEDRAAKSGRKIPLHVVVTPATDRENLLPPIFMIDGGPGIGASHWSYFYTELDDTYRRRHDLVYVDVRGTGQSHPLHCLELQTRASIEEQLGAAYPAEDIEDCLRQYRDSIDFGMYNTKHTVDDLEEVRQWLGYDKINLYGVSYGGKVALTFIDRHPGSIHKAVLHAPSLPWINNHISRAASAQQAMEILFARCAGDSLCSSAYPDFPQLFSALQARLESAPARIKAPDGQGQEIEITWSDMAFKFFGMLYSDAEYVRIPYIVYEAYGGNYDPFLAEFDFNDIGPNLFFADGLFLSVICAEEIGLPTAEQTPFAGSFLGDVVYQERREACGRWPVVDVSGEYDQVIASDVPVLIFTGALDPVVPTSFGDELVAHFPNAQHIVIPHMGHMLANLSNPACYDDYVVAYFDEREGEAAVDCFQEMTAGPFKLRD